MRQRILGRTGIAVSEVGLGGLFLSRLGSGAADCRAAVVRAVERGVPLLDLEREVLARRPDDWFGPLMDRIHLTAGAVNVEPTAENLARSGYLLRGWLTVRKVAEIKRRVLDEPVKP